MIVLQQSCGGGSGALDILRGTVPGHGKGYRRAETG